MSYRSKFLLLVILGVTVVTAAIQLAHCYFNVEPASESTPESAGGLAGARAIDAQPAHSARAIYIHPNERNRQRPHARGMITVI